MTAENIIAEIKALPKGERTKVLAYCGQILEEDDSWVPASFKQGMADAAAGRLADMETVLSGAPPPPRGQ